MMKGIEAAHLLVERGADVVLAVKVGAGGRLVLFTSSRELRGTPAAPEPMASRIHFYEDQELMQLARMAGFAEYASSAPISSHSHAKLD